MKGKLEGLGRVRILNNKAFKGVCLLFTALFVLLSIVPTVRAQYVQQSQVNLIPWLDSQLGQDYDYVNAGNFSGPDQFRGILDDNGYGSNGIYWGQSIPAYLVDFGYIDYEVNIVCLINLTRQDIINGAFDFWLKIPVDGTKVDSFTINFNGVIYSLSDSKPKNIIFDKSGVYVRCLQFIGPGLNNINITVKPLAGFSIPVYMGNEDYTINNDKYIFIERDSYSIYKNGSNITNNIIKNRIVEDFPGGIPLSFIFREGTDLYGFSSLKIDSLETVLSVQLLVYDTYSRSYPSLYVPFRSSDPVDFIISFIIIDSDPSKWGFTNPFDDATDKRIVWANLSGQKEYIKVSCPWYLNNTAYPGGAAISPISMFVQFTPLTPISVLCDFSSNYFIVKNFYDFNGNHTPAINTIPNINYGGGPGSYSVFGVIDYSNGIWSKVYDYDYILEIDTGLVRGYRYPGYIELNIFFDNGAEVFFNGSANDFWNEILESPYTRQAASNDALNSAIQWVNDRYLNNLVVAKEGGAGILDFLIEFLKKVWAFAQEVFDYLNDLIILIPIFLALAVPQWIGYTYILKKDPSTQLTELKGSINKIRNRSKKPFVDHFNRARDRANTKRFRADNKNRGV